MEKPPIDTTPDNTNLPKQENKEEIKKYLDGYFLREDDDWEESLLGNRSDQLNPKSILEERNRDKENIENYQNGQQLKLVIFNTYLEILNRFIINKKREDGIYEGPQVAHNWHLSKDSPYGEFTKELLLKHVNLRYDLLEEVLNSKIKPLLIGSEFKNSKGELIKIKNVDFTSGEINLEHHKSENDKRNYYEVIKTSLPLQEHILSIIKTVKTKE